MFNNALGSVLPARCSDTVPHAEIFRTQRRGQSRVVYRPARSIGSLVAAVELMPGILLPLSCLAHSCRTGVIGIGAEVDSVACSSGGRAAQQQLAVTLRQPDGSLRDVTAACRYEVEPDSIAAVTSAGIVFPRSDGSASLRATFQNETAEVEAARRARRLDS